MDGWGIENNIIPVNVKIKTQSPLQQTRIQRKYYGGVGRSAVTEVALVLFLFRKSLCQFQLLLPNCLQYSSSAGASCIKIGQI